MARVATAWGEPERADLTYSVAKTYLGMLAGVAHGQGLLPDVDEPVVARAPRHRLRFAAQPRGHLAPSAGADQRVGGQQLRHSRHGGPLSTRVARPAASRRAARATRGRCRRRAATGNTTTCASTSSRWRCCTLFSRPLPEVFDETLMQPLECSATWRWRGYDDAWVDVGGRQVQSVPGGTHWGAGVSISARDQARLGQLLLDDGQSRRAPVDSRSVGAAHARARRDRARSTAGCCGSTAMDARSLARQRRRAAWWAPVDTWCGSSPHDSGGGGGAGWTRRTRRASCSA